jgi:hypothetical protein
MELNAESFKQYFKLIEQRLKEVGKLKHSPSEYRDFDFITIRNGEITIVVEYSSDSNEHYEVPEEYFYKPLEELQELFQKEYDDRQTKIIADRLLYERKQYETLKAKFERQ